MKQHPVLKWFIMQLFKTHRSTGNIFSQTDPCFVNGIKNMSDREEAVIILKWLLVELNNLADKKPGDYDDIEEAEELLADWK